MVMKLFGFASGALAAALAVWGFNTWRHVSDDDRLTLILADHCLPYVQTGAIPFGDIGRTPGVYDEVDLRGGFTDDGAALLYDNRFVAQWGIAPDGSGGELRACDVQPTYKDDTTAGFLVDADGFVARYTDVIATAEPLIPEVDVLTDGPLTFGWFGADRPQLEGLRVVMVASPGVVSSAIVVGPVAP